MRLQVGTWAFHESYKLLNVRTSMWFNWWLTTTQGRVCRCLFRMYLPFLNNRNFLPDLEFWTLFASAWTEGPQRLCALLCLLCGQHPAGDWRWQRRNQSRCLLTWPQWSSCSLGKPSAPYWGPVVMWQGSTASGVLLDEAFSLLSVVHVVFQICSLELEESISCVCEEAHALVICSWFSAVRLRMSHLSSWIRTKGWL